MMIGDKFQLPDALNLDDHSSFSPPVSGDGNDDFALTRYLPSNSNGDVESETGRDVDFPAGGSHSCDDFRMFDFKVRWCARGVSHDWTECPYAHPGEKARRRDPRKYHYSGAACPDYKKGACRKGDACEYAHGVFECWLHPARYRTQPCKDGLNCTRRICFFAHAPVQLRVLSPRTAYSGSPPPDSPPASPIVAALRQESQLSRFNSFPPSWSPIMGPAAKQRIRTGFWSTPATPTRPVGRPGSGQFDIWEEDWGKEADAPMERVESGRDVRAKMFERIGKENPLDGRDPRSDPFPTRYDAFNPDVGWVSELVQ
ncbi:unnamed protein product [Cuscuta campestris]|uniref:C3H1-type domain-containing protein n=1 Tax=Cuscuta campestris TaxID=132261 RepID=A0A484KXS3_9ASTE|nr:unnamed protein product [Cuscuta campestris]